MTIDLHGKTKIEQIETIKKYLDKIINKEIDEFYCRGVISSDICDYFDFYNNRDYNGWQCDWWDKMQYEGITFTVSGSAWYGTVGFAIDDEE